MPLRYPRRGILAVLETRGPLSTEELAERIKGAAELLAEMERDREVVRGEDGRWCRPSGSNGH